MKKLTFGILIVVFTTMSSFTQKEYIYKICKYNVYSTSGQYLGKWEINVPDNVDCGSKEAKSLAAASYNLYH